MNAETRAKELIFALEATTSSDVITSARQRDLIIKAIVSAQNDKLEEAARLMDRVMADSKAALIRTLKHED